MATGIISQRLEAARTMLAASAAFQSWCGATSAATALDCTFRHKLPDPADGDRDQHTRLELETLYPAVALVSLREIGGFTTHYVSSHGWADEGYVDVRLLMIQPAGQTHQQADEAFDDSLGGIVEDLFTLTHQADMLPLAIETPIELTWGPARRPQEEEADEYYDLAACLTIHFDGGRVGG